MSSKRIILKQNFYRIENLSISFEKTFKTKKKCVIIIVQKYI